ncbi:MAG: HAMP domain-containing protein [Azospirillum sp.]|nr:HAMP domain-containing protein [Azospirillum sp.]
MLTRLPIGVRLQFILAASLIGMFAVAVLGLINLRSAMLADRETQIQQLVDGATSIVAVYHDRAAKGEITDADARQAALDTLRAIRYAGDNYLWVNDLSGILLMHPFRPKEVSERTSMLELKDPNGVRIYQELVAAAKKGAGFVSYGGRRPGDKQMTAPKLAYTKLFAPWGWAIGTGIYIDDVDAAFAHDALYLGSIGAAVAFAVIGITILIGRTVTRPLARLTHNMRRLAQGDTAIDVSDAKRGDEVGTLAGAMATFRDNAHEMERLRAEQELAKKRSEDERRAITARLADNLEASVASVVQAMAEQCHTMRDTAEAMTRIAEETSHQASTVAAASEEASTNVQTVATAATELSSSIEEINRQMVRSTEISGKAVTEAAAANQRVAGLTEAADRIGKVVELITAIASQTNLLALNATIEAARAGDAGKGFAVVASEVKNLAGQTAKATEEIATQVGGIQTVTGETATAIQGIGRTIGELNEIATVIAAAVEEQGAATREISRNVEQAALGTQQVSSTISAVDDTARRSGDAARSVLTSASRLAEQARQLRGDIEGFLAEVRRG